MLTGLLDYFVPLATRRLVLTGGVRLCSPGVNVLGLNAAYLSATALSGPAALRALGQQLAAEGGNVPPLVASTVSLPGQRVGALRVGRFTSAETEESVFHVEQVSRLQISLWAQILAEAYNTPEWSGAIARYFAQHLESRRDYVLLLAYKDHEAVGALLWFAAPAGGAAHLWGTLDPAADQALLTAAAALGGGELQVSLPSGSALALEDEETILFTLLSGLT